jgi:hypothetical protein
MKGFCRLAALLFILVAMLPVPKAALAGPRSCESLQGQPCTQAGTTINCTWNIGTPEQRAGSCICEPYWPGYQPWTCA